MKKTAPILRHEGANLSSITRLRLKQLKLLLMLSNNSSLELDGRVSQQFLPRDVKKCTFPLWLPSCKRESFILVFPPAHHGKDSKRIRSWYPLIDFQCSRIQSKPFEDKQDFPKGNTNRQTTVLNLLAHVSLLGWDVLPSKFFCWRNSSWGPLVIIQTVAPTGTGTMYTEEVLLCMDSEVYLLITVRACIAI